MNDKTRLFKIVTDDQAKVHKTLYEVYNSLKERGYNPTNQIQGARQLPGRLQTSRPAHARTKADEGSEKPGTGHPPAIR